jgi:hypothetical protein
LLKVDGKDYALIKCTSRVKTSCTLSKLLQPGQKISVKAEKPAEYYDEEVDEEEQTASVSFSGALMELHRSRI